MMNTPNPIGQQEIENRIYTIRKMFGQIFSALESKDKIPEKGLFFDGQIFDAWQFVSEKEMVCLLKNGCNHIKFAEQTQFQFINEHL